MTEWTLAVVDTSATYLGEQVRRGRVGKEWTKYGDKVQGWRGISPGFLRTIQAHNTFQTIGSNISIHFPLNFIVERLLWNKHRNNNKCKC